jgi:hypothetical protein
LRRSFALWWPLVGRAAILLLTPLLVSACAVSHLSNPFRSGTPDDAASAVTPDKMLETAKADSGQDMPASGTASHCPQVVAWPHDRLLTVYEAGHNGDSLSVVHRGEITKLARECQLYSDRVTVKYGFAGRILLGPRGQPGTFTLPITIHVANVDHKVLANDAVKISATIAPGEPVGYFSMVKEVTFPIVVGTRPEDYKVFVAFNRPQGTG